MKSLVSGTFNSLSRVLCTLSITLLVRYRSYVTIQACEGYTSFSFELHSQTALLPTGSHDWPQSPIKKAGMNKEEKEREYLLNFGIPFTSHILV
jgi:hypothetical protein